MPENIKGLLIDKYKKEFFNQLKISSDILKMNDILEILLNLSLDENDNLQYDKFLCLVEELTTSI